MNDLTIKGLKICAWASQETLCYQCSLYWHGQKVADASNEGHGGPDNFYFSDAGMRKEVTMWAEAQSDVDFEHLGQIVGSLIADVEDLRWKRRQCKKKTLFRLTGDKATSFRVLKDAFTPTVEKFLIDKYKDKGLHIVNKEAGV